MHMGRVLGASCEPSTVSDRIALAQTTFSQCVWGDNLGVLLGPWLAWLGIRLLAEW